MNEEYLRNIIKRLVEENEDFKERIKFLEDSFINLTENVLQLSNAFNKHRF